MRWAKLMTVIIVIGLAGGALRGESIDYVTSLLWTGLYDVQAEGDIACANFVNGVVILDISDPSMPEFISRLPLADPDRQIYCADNYLYVANGNYDLEIFDVSDPAHPQAVSHIDADHPAKSIKVFGDYAFLTTEWSEQSGDTYDEIIMLNVADRANPMEVSRFNAYFHLPVKDISLNEDIAYVTYSGGRLIEGYNIQFGGLAVFDLADPANPEMTADAQTYDNGYQNVYADGNFAYVTHNTNGLMIFSTIYPSFLFLDTSYAVDGYARDIHVKDNYAYVSVPGVTSKIYVLDIANPANPALESLYSSDDYIANFSMTGDYIFTGDFNDGVGVVDISDPSNLADVGSYDVPYSVLNTYVRDGLAYVTLDNSGLQIIDVANPAEPMLSGYYDSGSRPHNVYVSGNYAYIADFSSGLQILDVSDPDNPQLTGSYPLQREAHGLAIEGNYVFVAAGTGGLQVINVEDRTNPQFVNSLTFQGYARDICVDGNYAYIPSDAFGLRIVDISNPAQPSLTGTYNSPSSATAVAVEGIHAYLADGYGGGFYIIDISDPEHPIETGHLMLGGTASDVFLFDGYAFVASDDLYAINIANPTNPTIAAVYQTPYYARGLYVDGDYIYVADEASMMVLHFDSQVGIEDSPLELPSKVALYQNYPNPFNAVTTIKYDLAQPSQVVIDIYDILGRKVTELTNDFQPAGQHQVNWNASELSSGMYLYKIQAGDYTSSRKMIYLK